MHLSLFFVHEDADARQSRRIRMRRKMLAEFRCESELVKREKMSPRITRMDANKAALRRAPKALCAKFFICL
jgi:hypothetical protein